MLMHMYTRDKKHTCIDFHVPFSCVSLKCIGMEKVLRRICWWFKITLQTKFYLVVLCLSFVLKRIGPTWAIVFCYDIAIPIAAFVFCFDYVLPAPQFRIHHSDYCRFYLITFTLFALNRCTYSFTFNLILRNLQSIIRIFAK